MGRVHIWRPKARATVGSGPRDDLDYYLELNATDDERDVRMWWDERTSSPQFILAPNAFDSRTNSVIAANTRRILGENIPIAVMIHGKKRRERMDMTHWLIENDYLPMFPRYMTTNATVPMTRHQLVHEVRPILDREPAGMFMCYNWKLGLGQEEAVLDYIRSTGNSWELLSL